MRTPSPKSVPIDLAAVRERLRSSRGPQYWRSLDEAARTEAFGEFLHREFPEQASEWLEPFDRRGFLKLMGASLALAGLTACTKQPSERIAPYVNQPEELVPGKPLFYATAMTLGGFATGLLVESHEGHPTKIEGNPDHSMSLGASNIFHQASLLDLYDPDRSQRIQFGGRGSSWETFLSALHELLPGLQAKHGAGLRILTETVTSPTLHAQLQAVLMKFPGARWHQFEPVNRDSVRDGARLAFGQEVEAQYQFDQARTVLSLDADFMFSHPAALRHTRDFMRGRRLRADHAAMNRFYAVESTPSVTGSNADHRLALRSGEIEAFTRSLARQLGAISDDAGSPSRGAHSEWISVLVGELLQNRGRSIVIAGESQPPIVHALAHVMNHFLGNAGDTIHYAAPAEPQPTNQLESLRDLVDDLKGGAVTLLVMLGGNPVYNAPADLDFAQHALTARWRVHLSPDVNETSAICHWHIPQNHYLESWGDARAYDGTISIVQPVILPLYAGKSAHEVLEAFGTRPVRADYEIVRDHWRTQNRWPDFEKGWRRALHDGLIAGTASPARTLNLRALKVPPSSTAPVEKLEVLFRPDPTIWDGRFANNGWLQELAKPITKLTWDNAALLSPATAQRRALSNGDVVALECNGRTLRLPIFITPGQADESVTVHLGYGRTLVGRVGSGTGFNAFVLRTSSALWSGSDIQMTKTGAQISLATTQTHQVIDSEEREIYREATLAEFLARSDSAGESTKPAGPETETLFNPAEHRTEGHQWGMSIDLTACIGCNACVLACQSENNIPVVGKEQVAKHREMQWIRIDTYFSGEPEHPAIRHQPVPCMHCENAPCELVCPVAATLHDKEGLNLQVYNRCIGTRYCSNNCPYKVRRFNFFQYADHHTPSLKPMRNPNVTVRSRGVMEKCTYCVQRIAAARITSREEDRPIRDGEIRTACQQVCPAEAIVFGDLSDPNSRVSQLKKLRLDFSMLAGLNTRPRTTYLTKLRNPNPAFPLQRTAATLPPSHA